MGFPRHLSQHVGGFVLTRGPLIEVVPVGNAAMADRTFIEWDKDDIAALGLLKVDVLALGMLTCIRKAFDLIEKHHGLSMTLANVPRDDAADLRHAVPRRFDWRVPGRKPGADEHAAAPQAADAFTISSSRSRSCGRGRSRATWCTPICAAATGSRRKSIHRPAPEHGPADELKEILSKTKGVPLFQEQAMRIAMVAAKFSDREVNELRRAMATFRRVGTIGLLEEKMVSRMVARGYDQEFAARCFSQIKGFGEYGFPESHAASFAHLVYVSSWIKCHFPAAFAARSVEFAADGILRARADRPRCPRAWRRGARRGCQFFRMGFDVGRSRTPNEAGLRYRGLRKRHSGFRESGGLASKIR